MPSTIGKNLNLCFTKIIRRPSPPMSSLQEDLRNRPLSNSMTTSSILIKNFNSLYDFTLDCATNSKSLAHSSTASDDLSAPESDDETTTPDISTVFASRRFFFSSPGRSNSIVDSSSMALTSPSSAANQAESGSQMVGTANSIAVQTYSPDPYMDFRRSMQEMVEARELMDVRANWDYLHELLISYLSLNPKSTHKFIVGAFADLLVTLMTSF